MKMSVMFPSKYLKAEDLQGRNVTVTIKAVTIDEVTMLGGVKNKKGIVWFEGKEKQLILNKGNAVAIDHVLDGKGETSNWIGKEITLTPAQTFDKRDKVLVPCIRIRRAEDGKVFFIEVKRGGWFDCEIGKRPAEMEVGE